MRYNRVTPGLGLSQLSKGMRTSSQAFQNSMENQAPALGFLEYLAEGVMILDSDRVIRAVNSALERMLGWSAAELYGVSCQQIFGCHQERRAPGG